MAFAPQMQAELTALRADPTLETLHQDAVKWRHERFETLMKQEPYRALFGRLLMTPSSRAIPLKEARFLMHYANLGRAEAEPDAS